MVRFLRIDPMVNDLSLLRPHFQLERGNLPALCNSRRSSHEARSHREEGPGHCSMSKKLLLVQTSIFDVYVESYKNGLQLVMKIH